MQKKKYMDSEYMSYTEKNYWILSLQDILLEQSTVKEPKITI